VSSILITCRNINAVQQHYEPALRRCGWTGAIQLATPDQPLPPLADFLGLVLTGGDDIHPCRWDPREALDPTAEPDPARDELEIRAVGQAWALGRPILGICRGEQLLNVALGGSLFQDLPSRLGLEPGLHRRGSSAQPELAHPVRVDPGSRLGRLLGVEELEVNSRHHQAVDRISAELRAVAWCRSASAGQPPVELVEAIEARDPGRWALGVQWHPENLVGLDSPAGQGAKAIFRGFLAALEP
jgi:putative glutamine amidotransferase